MNTIVTQCRVGSLSDLIFQALELSFTKYDHVPANSTRCYVNKA